MCPQHIITSPFQKFSFKVSLEGNCSEQDVKQDNEKKREEQNTSLWHKLRSKYERTK